MNTFDIRLQADPVNQFENSERVILFDESLYGYFCFLSPFLENLAKRTSQFVDWEGDAVYGGVTLRSLSEAIMEAKRQLTYKPEYWEEHTYTLISPHHEEVCETLSKEKMDEIISTIETALEKAKVDNQYIVFLA